MSTQKENEVLLESAKIYEQVLGKIPYDVFSIEALIDIYSQLGDETKVNKLKKNLLKVEQGETPEPLTNSVKSIASPRSIEVSTKAVVNKQVSLKARPTVMVPVPPNWRRKNQELDKIKMTKALVDLVFTLRYSLKSQVDLMVSLYDVELLTKSQYTEIVYKLSNHRFPRNPSKPKMVVHMLEECPEVEMDKVQYFFSRKSNLNYIDLSTMKFNATLYDVLPETVMYNHGIIVFNKTGNSYWIAVLNPLNVELMEKTAVLLGVKIHFFITSAAEFDAYTRKGVKQRS